MYFVLFRFLNFPAETEQKLCLIDSATCWSVLSSEFCNMLMCATIFPPRALDFLRVQSEGKAQRILLMMLAVYMCTCDICCSGWGGCGRYQIGSRNKIPSGLLLIPLPQNTDTHAHSTRLRSPSLLCTHTHMQLFLLQIQPTQLNCLKVNLPYNYYPCWDSQQFPIPSPCSEFR